MKRKIGMIGYFATGKSKSGGQEAKTCTLADELDKIYGEDRVLKIDTIGWKKHPFKLFFNLIKIGVTCENAVMLPAQNSLPVFTTVLTGLTKITGCKIHYVVIGGWLAELLTKRKGLAKSLKRFDGIYVETAAMKGALETQGFENVFVMPNCKKLTVLSEGELVYPQGEPYKLCTFSRILKEKGIGDAVKTVTEVNRSLGRTVFSLDIYGQVDENQTDWFEALRKTFPDFIRYGGVIPFDRSVETLKEYFALLFPTYYDGEGFAGTLIDAFSAGVPVIASDWKYNKELVNENVGYVCKTRDNAALAELLKSVAADPTMILSKKKSCLHEAQRYTAERVIKTLVNRLGK